MNDNPSLAIRPIGHPLHASVRVPGSKSLTNRALLLAALARGTTHLVNALFSDDSLHFARALQALGFDVSLDEAGRSMTVTGQGGRIPARQADLFIGNAGTAARFLTAFLTLGNGTFTLDGDARMRERPIGDLVSALVELGAQVEPVGGEQGRPVCPPLRITAGGLRGGPVQVAGDVSSQYLSALLMVAPYARGPVEIQITGELTSRPYVEMTLAVMRDFRIEVRREGSGRFLVRPAAYHPLPVHSVEADATAACYFFAAPAVCGGLVRVEGVRRDSRQGDLAFLDVLTRMGCSVLEGRDSIEVAGPTFFTGVDADLRDIPDTAQTLAAIAPFAGSPTRIRGVASSRVKETDRIRATCTELARLGVPVEEHADGMTIRPCAQFAPGRVRTYNDHRMAMAFSLIGLRVDGVTIENPACVSKTFPDFFEVLEGLR